LFADVRLSELVLHLALQGRGQPVSALVPMNPKAAIDAARWALANGKPSPELERALRQALDAAAQSDVEKQMARELAEYVLARVAEELPALLGEGAPEAALLASMPLLITPG